MTRIIGNGASEPCGIATLVPIQLVRVPAGPPAEGGAGSRAGTETVEGCR
jgi:hypothetical protein